MTTVSSEKSSSLAEVVFSHKRYFINNLDSYHGQYVLKEMSKFLDKNNMPSTKESSRTLLGEDAAAPPPPPPDQPYEIYGIFCRF